MPVLDRSHPLARGLIWCVAGATKAELVGSAGLLSVGSGVTAATFAGRTIWGKGYESTVTNGTNYVEFSNGRIEPTSSSPILNQHTIVIAIDIDSLSAGNGIVSLGTSGSWVAPYQDLAFGHDSGGTAFGEWYSGGGRQVWIPSGSPTVFTTGPHVYGWSRDGINQSLYKDSRLIISESTVLNIDNVDFSGSHRRVAINGLSSVLPNDSQDCRVYMVGIWNRVLSAGEHALIGKNPNIMLRRWADPLDLTPGLLAPVGGTPIVPAGILVRQRPLRNVGHNWYLQP